MANMKMMIQMVFCVPFLLITWWLSTITMAAPPPRLVRCRSKIYTTCSNVKFRCPLACPRNCMVDCALCRPVCSCNYPGAVCQDPRFVGGDGITFYFHGQKDQNFCLVSDNNLHINAHFIGKRNPKLKRDFTWVQSIGIMFDNHKILVAAQRTSIWNDNQDHLTLSFDDQPVSLPTNVGSKWDSQIAPEVSISRTNNANGVLIDVTNYFRITANVVPITYEDSKVHGYNITHEDCFAHLEVGFKFKNLSNAVDGVLGQTYRRSYESKIKVNVPMPVMGGAHKFRTLGIFDTNCAVSRFGKNYNKRQNLELKEGFECKSGMQGKGGIVCK